ncbi:MAG: lysylphosphatidylglycerol synthase domain-containing protein, partial [Leifsonia sp.]
MRGPSPRTRRLLQLGFGAVVVVGTIAVVGTGPVIRGVLALSPAAILLAAAFTAMATCAAVWRWRTVSTALGMPLGPGAAVAAYYRSQFLNTVLPGGVVGDVHRAYRQGLPRGAIPLAARAVATERVAGQLVQAVMTAEV